MCAWASGSPVMRLIIIPSTFAGFGSGVVVSVWAASPLANANTHKNWRTRFTNWAICHLLVANGCSFLQIFYYLLSVSDRDHHCTRCRVMNVFVQSLIVEICHGIDP